MLNPSIELTPVGNAKTRDSEPCTLVITLKDDGDPASTTVKSAINAVRVTLRDCNGEVINDRNGEDAYDTAFGEVADSGEITLYLDAADNPFVSNGKYEEWHYVEVRWDWTASSGREYVDSAEFFKYKVYAITL